jgi:hypothetical protein
MALDPTKMKSWQLFQRVVQLIAIFNLAAFCLFMLVMILSKATMPTVATPVERQDSTVFDRAQKYD